MINILRHKIFINCATVQTSVQTSKLHACKMGVQNGCANTPLTGGGYICTPILHTTIFTRSLAQLHARTYTLHKK